jgi:pyrroline-5-carboxylate reductase
MEEGGINVGLSKETARKLAIDTLYGASLMATSTRMEFDDLINMVKTPGGTTERGLKVLQEYSLEEALIKAIKKATERSKELGEVYGKC